MTRAFNMDCMEAMKQFPDKYFDLAVVDPPYGIKAAKYTRGGKQYGHSVAPSADYGCATWDNAPPDNEYFNELRRVSKNQIVWGANHFISRFPMDSSCWVVWDKENGDNGYADCELAWTSFTCAVRIFRFRWQGMLQGDMKHKETRIHVTQKPVALYTWLYERFAKPGDKILDTHLGSGSSRIAAYEMGLDFTGYEINKVIFDLEEERFKSHTAQMNLFIDGDLLR